MPGHHVHVMIGDIRDNGKTTIFSSRGGGGYHIYVEDVPMGGFPALPLAHCRYAGSYGNTRVSLRHYFAASTSDYIDMEIYRDYDSSARRTLYCYVRKRVFRGRWLWDLWVLHMPSRVPPGAVNTGEYPYPSPCDWYLAVRRTYGGCYEFDDYEFVASRL